MKRELHLKICGKEFVLVCENKNKSYPRLNNAIQAFVGKEIKITFNHGQQPLLFAVFKAEVIPKCPEIYSGDAGLVTLKDRDGRGIGLTPWDARGVLRSIAA